MRRIAPLLALVLALPGCRDTVAPFASRDRVPFSAGEEPLRLTYSRADDRSPAWSAGSDSIYYSTSQWEDVPDSEGILMAIHRDGGVARVLLAGQPGKVPAERLIEPAPVAAGTEVAFAELRPLAPSNPCGAGAHLECGGGAGSLLPSPPLTEAWLRTTESADSQQTSVLMQLGFAGGARLLQEVIGGLPVHESHYHPAQHRWIRERLLPVKPSWSPSGDSIVTSDGAGILVVDVATGTHSTIAGGYASNPAWSPDGEWIAFDRVEALDTVIDMCLHYGYYAKDDTILPWCWERRVYYELTEPSLYLIRSDGSAERMVGAGFDPVWDPSGRILYYAAAGSIRRIVLETGVDTAVEGTEGGAEPAVSPDGAWLAFTRYQQSAGGRDVWVVATGIVD